MQFRGLQGWAYSRYMMLNAGGRQIVVTQPADMQGVPIMNYQAPAYASPGFATPRAAYRSAPRVVETMGAAPVMASDEALVAGIVGLVGDHVRIGRLDRLAELKPELVQLTLLPYLGFAESQRWASQSVDLG